MPTFSTPVARSPLLAWQLARGARTIDRDGWRIATAFTDPAQEASAARTGLGLGDLTASTKFSFRGSGVAELTHRLGDGGALSSPRRFAEVLGREATAYRQTSDQLLIVARPGFPLRQVHDLAAGTPVVVTDLTGGLAGFVLVGPRLDATLAQLTPIDLRPGDFPPGTCTETAFAGVEALLARPAVTPLPMLRIFVAWDVAEYVWERILASAPDGAISLLGGEALRELGIG